MKTLKFSAIIVVTMIMMTGCGDKFPSYKSPSFISCYYMIDSISVDVHVLEECLSDRNPPYVSINFLSDGSEYVSWCPSHDNTEFLQKYAGRYNDTRYHREVVYHGCEPADIVNIAMYPDMTGGISLTCDSDYDAEHPAGALLNDIMRYSGASRYKYIEMYNHYCEEPWRACPADQIMWNRISSFNDIFDDVNISGCLYPVFKYMDELTADDLKLGGIPSINSIIPFCFLTFTKLPEEKGIHNFTLTMNGENGKVYTAKFSYDFSSNK